MLKIKISVIFLCIIFILALSYLTGCFRDFNPLEVKADDEFYPRYAPGQVSVCTMDTVSNEFFESFVINLGLTLIHNVVYFWIELPPDSADYFKSQLKNPPFSEKNYENYLYDDIDSSKIYLRTRYKYGEDASDLTEGEAILDSLGLTLKRVDVYPVGRPFRYVVSVPVGTEEYWVERFETYPFIKWAERIIILSIF